MGEYGYTIGDLRCTELESNEVCVYSGSGAIGKSTPEEYRDFQKGLHDLFDIGYMYLLEWERRDRGLTKEELEEVKTIVFTYSEADDNGTILLIRDKGRMYLGEGCDLLAAGVVPPKPHYMEEGTWGEILRLLGSCGVPYWETEYPGGNNGTGEKFSWSLLLETEDNRVCSYGGWGSKDKGAPGE